MKKGTKKKAASISETVVAEIAQKPERMPVGTLDELFIEYYLETASAKESYKKACKAVDKVFKEKYTCQYGKAMFDRLKIRINDALLAADVEDKALGRKKMRQLCNNAQSESVQAQMASNLAKGLYPDVVVEQDHQTYEEIEQAIKENERQLNESKGIH